MEKDAGVPLPQKHLLNMCFNAFRHNAPMEGIIRFKTHSFENALNLASLTYIGGYPFYPILHTDFLYRLSKCYLYLSVWYNECYSYYGYSDRSG